ncbi:MBL fold metallo-hydrolase [Parvibaculum sp.]|jgi:N-acyl-phosphatidylethanolamine-hydrolysing phospholipase D|uniref:MBL fold metallo-hydrolase n=1 Tax=Parvibaculum sp. TaxID=2024848 RepID=UPI000C3B26CE|nr:MBL fold metallo-hydrolase [Parvibaculum sp.]MAM94571.1 hydrolase [Parvibaculum sp.]HCX68848.1 hydrolase [Rhodobiaceae bacterium]|tara:strand:+ start:719 stop:1801 length:1083 start_codon:yes stop_codon:yes gene_type:complete
MTNRRASSKRTRKETGKPASGAGVRETSRPWHHMPDGTFRNPPGCASRGQGRMKHAGPFFLEMLKMGARKVDVPEGHVVPRPQAVRELNSHAQADDDFITWLGHASFLIRIGGLTVLTDPYLTTFAGPAGLGPRRYVKSGVPISALPQIDVLVVSHNHYDHLDERALARLPNKEKMTVVVPLRLARFFRERGFPNVIELDWHERYEVRGVSLTALPVVHWSRRSGFDTNRTLWAGFAMKSENHHLFFGGDSGYGPIFRDIGEAYGPFDTALLGIGAYEPREMMKASHATPEEAVQMGRDLKARRIVGMHWGTVLLTVEPPFEPPERFVKAADAEGYEPENTWIMRIGETRDLAGSWPSNA